MYNYYRLTSQAYNGFIIRQDQSGREEYYNFEHHQWERIGIMIRYTWPDSDTYGMYDHLSEYEVNQLIA